MEDSKLTQLIAESIEISEAEQRRQKALDEANEVEFNRLLTEATTARLAKTTGIPPSLLPYCKGVMRRDGWGVGDDINQLKGGWRPMTFEIAAPGLASLSFTVQEELDYSQSGRSADQYVIRHISVDHCRYQQWSQAIAEAARIYQHNEERRRANSAVEKSIYNAAMKHPSTAERLVELMEEIIADKVEELLAPNGAF